jgi:hypothetical protein
MSNGLTPAVIVMRHFEDLDNPLVPDPYCYKMPGGSLIEVPWRRLSSHGIGASLNYATALPNMIQNLKLCPVSRVITQAPQDPQHTQNPFDSVYPFLFHLNLLDVKLLPDGQSLLSTPHSQLLPGDQSHSTVICFDKQTLWGDKTYDPSLFLTKMTRGDTRRLQPAPVKAPTMGSPGIYVFKNYGSDDKFDLDIHPTITGEAATGPQPTKGKCSGS